MNLTCFSSFAAVLAGLAVLWWAGDLVVHCAVKIAQIFNFSTFFVGFLVLAVAANIPELAVAISAGLSGASAVSAGDIIGGNFSHIALVLGVVMVLAGSIKIYDTERWWLLSLLGIIGCINGLLFGVGVITRMHGLLLILIYMVAIVWIWRAERKEQRIHQREHYEKMLHEKITLGEKVLRVVKLLGSLALVFLASSFTIHFSVMSAQLCHLPLHIMGATIVGLGTALPELVLCLSALKKKHYGLILGPMLGNILGHGTLIMGILALCSPQPVDIRPMRTTAVFIFISFIIIAYGFIKKSVGRVMGAILVLLFIVYLTYQFLPIIS